MMEWVLLAALASKAIDEVVVTSEDPEILACATDLGARAFPRTPAFSEPDVTRFPAIREVVQHSALAAGDLVVALQPTTPLLRTGTLSDIVRSARSRIRSSAEYLNVFRRPVEEPGYIISTEGLTPEKPTIGTPDVAMSARALTEHSIYPVGVQVFRPTAFMQMREVDTGPVAGWCHPYLLGYEVEGLDIDYEWQAVLAEAYLRQREASPVPLVRTGTTVGTLGEALDIRPVHGSDGVGLVLDADDRNLYVHGKPVGPVRGLRDSAMCGHP